MTSFPEHDNPMIPAMAEVFSDNLTIDRAHTQAESSSQLYKLGHNSIAATLDTLNIDPATTKATLSGVRAYEILGAALQGQDDLAKYKSDYVMRIMGDFGHDSNFDLHFLESLESDGASLRLETPLLAEAIATLASAELQDPSPELQRRAQNGAALLRGVQLEIDMMLAFEADLADNA